MGWITFLCKENPLVSTLCVQVVQLDCLFSFNDVLSRIGGKD